MQSVTGIRRRELLAGAPAILAARGANEALRVAAIGVGTRGHYLLQEVQKIARVEVTVISDLYQGNIARAKAICRNARVRVEPDWEKAVAAADVDAVIIATPDFWHAPMVLRAAREKKDIYVEKGWCTRLEDAKRMRAAVRESRVVMQLGHHYNSLETYHRARHIYRSGELGKVAVIRAYMDRAHVTPEWKFYTDYDTVTLPRDAGPETIDWERFIANAPRREFSAERFFTWRCWWDYGTGIAGDLLSHLWDGANMVVGLGIPETAQTLGGIYYWKDGRDVPDTWHVTFDYPQKELVFQFGCTFSNNHVGEVEQFLGRDKTLEVSEDFCRTYPAEWKPANERAARRLRQAAAFSGVNPLDVKVPPDYSQRPGEMKISSHLEDWVECVRSRQTPRCGVDRAFEEAVAILMSVEAWRRERQVRWDAAREEIV
jgi:predicted dehydrogenase